MNNDRKVWITLHNRITMDGMTDSVGVEAEGTLSLYGPLNVLRYDETDVDGSVTKVEISAISNRVSVAREGPVSSMMILELNKRNTCTFRMAEGMLTMDVELLDYTRQLTDDSYRWELHYLMHYGPSDPAEHRMTITAKPM